MTTITYSKRIIFLLIIFILNYAKHGFYRRYLFIKLAEQIKNFEKSFLKYTI